MFKKRIEAKIKDNLIYINRKDSNLKNDSIKDVLNNKNITSIDDIELIYLFENIVNFDEKQMYIRDQMSYFERYVYKLAYYLNIDINDNYVDMEEFDPNLLILFNIRHINDNIVFFLKTYIIDAVKDYIKENNIHFSNINWYDSKKSNKQNDKSTNSVSSLIDLINIKEETDEELLIDIDYDDVSNIEQIAHIEKDPNELNTINQSTIDDIKKDDFIDFNNYHNEIINIIDDFRDDILMKIELENNKSKDELSIKIEKVSKDLRELNNKLNKIIEAFNALSKNVKIIGDKVLKSK